MPKSKSVLKTSLRKRHFLSGNKEKQELEKEALRLRLRQKLAPCPFSMEEILFFHELEDIKRRFREKTAALEAEGEGVEISEDDEIIKDMNAFILRQVILRRQRE